MLLNRPITAIILILATFIFGTLSIKELSVDLLPAVDSPSFVVRTDWQGASPSEVERRINENLEASLSAVQGVQGTRGFARQGQSIINVTFGWGHNMDIAFLNVREALDRVPLPEDVRPQLIVNTTSDEPIATLAVTSNTRSNAEFQTQESLKRWVENVFSRRLEQADGISQVVSVGAVQSEIHIRYLPSELERYNLSQAQVEGFIDQASRFEQGGELRDGWYRYTLKIQSRLNDISDLESIPLTRLGLGRLLYLRDIAEVEMVEASPSSFAMLQGERVLNVLVKKEFGSNTVEVYDTMLPLLEEMREQYPDINIEILREDATFIRNAVGNLLQTLLMGGVLAFFVLFLFLNDFRTPFTIGVAIPTSIFLTFFVMYASGIQLNIVSLSGLTLGIGLLLDNAIVVLENINRHMPLTSSVKSAARAGTKEIALAVTASTLTTISVFLPLIFLGGFEGAFFKDQAYTLSISLLASLLVALIIIPVLVVKINERRELKLKEKGEIAQINTRKFFNRLLDAYEFSLQGALRHPILSLLCGLVLAVLAVLAFPYIEKSMLPEEEPESVSYTVELPGNTSLQTTMDVASVLEILLENEELGHGRIQLDGGYTDVTNLVNLSNEGFNKFRIIVPVSGWDEAEQVAAFMEQYDSDNSDRDVEATSDTQTWSTLIGANQPPVVFQILGENRSQSEQLAGTLQEMLNNAGLPVTLSKRYEQTVDTWNLTFNAEQMMNLGLSEQVVINHLESVTRGRHIADWNRDDEQVEIRLVAERGQIYDPSEIMINVNNTEIALNRIASLHRGEEPEQLERADQAPILSFVADWSLADWWWNQSKTEDVLIEFTRQTGGTEVLVTGNAVQVQNLMADMLGLLGLSVLIIYIILAVQFENLKYPLIIILAVPFAWVGSLLVLYLTGTGLNAMSFMGILILTGIAVNDSILKVDFMRRYLADTGNLRDAVELAGRHRFRPVVMTSVTTILGLVPMLIPFGDGFAFRQSLALALIGGMITSTILTLYLIPVIFRWVERNHKFELKPAGAALQHSSDKIQ